MTDLKPLIRTERRALIELLEGLTPEQWDTQSLCDRWTVKAVAAHLAYAPVMSPLRTATEMLRAGGNINRMIGDSARRDSKRKVAEILQQLRDNVETDAQPMGMPRAAGLADAVVHQLDIRRPLGLPRSVPVEAFAPVADFFAGTGFPGSLVVGGNVRRRISGLRLVADDADWSHGEGPEVHASREALLLMLSGRAVPGEELSGPGAAKLLPRLVRYY